MTMYPKRTAKATITIHKRDDRVRAHQRLRGLTAAVGGVVTSTIS
jgi:hypothetical protein